MKGAYLLLLRGVLYNHNYFSCMDLARVLEPDGILGDWQKKPLEPALLELLLPDKSHTEILTKYKMIL